MWQGQDRLMLGTKKGADVEVPMGILLDLRACCIVHCLTHLRGWAAMGACPSPTTCSYITLELSTTLLKPLFCKTLMN